MIAVPVHAEVADQALPLSVRSLFETVGVAPKEYALAIETCKGQATSIGGVKGIIAVAYGPHNCSANSADIGAAQQRPTFIISFRADMWVTNCVSFERAEHYLLGHGWRSVSYPPVLDLIPINADFKDEDGSTLTLEPHLKNSCLTSAKLRISATSVDR